MGKLMMISTNNLLPSQGFLKPGTIEHILESFKEETLDKLPPTPIVRTLPGTDKYVAIDGHNLIAVYDFLGKDIEIFIADSAEDKLPSSLANNAEGLESRNHELKKKYDSAIEAYRAEAKAGVDSFSALRRDYSNISE